MRYAMLCAALAIVVVLSESTLAINSVEIVGQDQVTPSSAIEIRVRLTNDVELRSIAIPLVFRGDSVNGIGADTRFTSIRYGWRDRLPRLGGPLSDIVINQMYDPVMRDSGTCSTDPFPGGPGGFGDNPAFIYGDTTRRVFSEMPVGSIFARYKIFSPHLPVGADVEGSILIGFEVNDQEGCFVIDTTCVNPAHHIVFFNASNESVPVEFSMGRVCVGIEECANAGLGTPILFDPYREPSSNVIEFSWDTVESALSYTIELDSSDETFTNPFYRNTTTEPTDEVMFEAGALGDILPLYWRVRANPGLPSTKARTAETGVPDCLGPWSTPMMFPMCDCPAQGDVAPASGGDGRTNLIDVVAVIDEAFFGAPPSVGVPPCPLYRSDVAPLNTCGDGLVNILDVLVLIDYAFQGGDPPCDPCFRD